jgi:hypothetical protein
LGRVKRLGFKLEEEARANILTEEVIKTSEIEGELLNLQMVLEKNSKTADPDITDWLSWFLGC